MNKEEIQEVLSRVIIEVLPEVKREQITNDQELVNLGANSIDRSEIIMQSMMELKVKSPLAEFAKLKKIGDIVDFYHAKING